MSSSGRLRFGSGQKRRCGDRGGLNNPLGREGDISQQRFQGAWLLVRPQGECDPERMQWLSTSRLIFCTFLQLPNYKGCCIVDSG